MAHPKRREFAASAQSATPSDRLTECLGAVEQRVIGELLRVRHRQIVEAPIPSRLLDLAKALEDAPVAPESRRPPKG
jgi:hypothetical protein